MELKLIITNMIVFQFHICKGAFFINEKKKVHQIEVNFKESRSITL